MSKRPLIIWSGGVDSTALVINYISNNIPFDTAYVKLPNNAKTQERELKARKKILKNLSKLYHSNSHCQDHVVEFVGTLRGADTQLEQPFVWATSLVFNLNLSNYSKIVFGYIKGDCFWHVKQEFEQLIQTADRLLRPGADTNIKFNYPLEWNSKQQVIQEHFLFDEQVAKVLPMTSYCEAPELSKKCKCVKCTDFNHTMTLIKKPKKVKNEQAK